MLVHWIWLSLRPGFNDRAKLELLEQLTDPEDAFYGDSRFISTLEGLSMEQRTALMDKDLTEAERIVEVCAKEKIGVLTLRDGAYPSRLRNIADPPLVLYYKGTLPDLEGRPLIGVVGTRKCSGYGEMVAKRMGFQITRCGGVVVTGMAAGIDEMATNGAILAGGATIGVLGCGADVVYPAKNRGLYEQVTQQGCLITEFPPGTPPYRWNFPKRNRIISGVSCGVLVVEAPEKSGALITARQAAEQGRDVFVVPGNIDMATCRGSNSLLRDGAASVFEGWDILMEYEELFPGKLSRQYTAEEPAGQVLKVAQPAKTLESTARKDKKVIDNGPKPLYSDVEKKLPPLNEQEQAIVDQLRQGPRLADAVIADSGISAGSALAVMTMLEVKGVICRQPGNRVALKEHGKV